MYILTYKNFNSKIIKLRFKHMQKANKQSEILNALGYKVLKVEFKEN